MRGRVVVFLLSVLMVTSVAAVPVGAQQSGPATDGGLDGPSIAGQSTAVAANETAGAQDWPAKGYDATNTGYNPDALAPTANPAEEWTFNVSVDHVGSDKDSANIGSSSPTIVNGTVYFGDVNGGRNYVYAVDVETGEFEWRADAGGWGESDVRTTPTVANGNVYVGDQDGQLMVLDAETGQEVFPPIDVGTGTASDRVNQPTVADGTVYFGSDQSKLHAYDANSGVIEWVFDMGSNTIEHAPAVRNGYVYATTGGHHEQYLYKIDAQTGQEVWNRTVMDASTSRDVLQAPVVANGHVYVGDQVSGRFDAAKLHAYDADTGDELWNFTTDEEIGAAPAAAGCTVYVGDRGGDLYAVDAGDGSEKWESTLPGRVRSAPTVANGHVYVGDDSGQFHAMNASNGVRSWAWRLDGRILTSPAPHDGNVYVGGSEKLYALTGDVADRRGDAPHGTSPCRRTDTNDAPNATFDHDPATPSPGETVSFDASDSSDGDGTIASYEWDFDGDGTVDATTTDATVTHSFASADDYDVNLTVIDDQGARASVTRTVPVAEASESLPSFEMTGETAAPGENATVTVTFTNDGTTTDSIGVQLPFAEPIDRDGWSIVGFDAPDTGQWFEHDRYFSAESIGPNEVVEATFTVSVPENASNGEYTIEASSASYTKNGSTTDATPSAVVDVTDSSDGGGDGDATTAAFSYTPSSPAPGEDVTLDASGSTGSDGTIASYEWDLDGDGTVDTTTSSPTVTHSFASAGDYDVTLTVTDGGGTAANVTKTITVATDDGSRSVEDYADENGNIGPSGVFQAVEDWRADEIGPTLVFDVIDAWRSE